MVVTQAISVIGMTWMTGLFLERILAGDNTAAYCLSPRVRLAQQERTAHASLDMTELDKVSCSCTLKPRFACRVLHSDI